MEPLPLASGVIKIASECKQPNVMHEMYCSYANTPKKDQLKAYEASQVLVAFKDDAMVIIHELVGEEQARKQRSNVEYIGMFPCSQIVSYEEDPRERVVSGFDLVDEDEAMIVDQVDVFKAILDKCCNDKVEQCVSKIEELAVATLADLVATRRLVLTRQHFYLLRNDVSHELWPFKIASPVHRDHIKLQTSAVTSQETFDLKLLSYNVLADKWLLSPLKRAATMRDKFLNPFCHLERDIRIALTLKEVAAAQADVMCFQEFDHAPVYREKLAAMGYELVTSVEREERDNITVGIAFKKDVL